MIFKQRKHTSKTGSTGKSLRSTQPRKNFSRLCRLNIEHLEPRLLLAGDTCEPNDALMDASVLSTPGSLTRSGIAITSGDLDYYLWQAANHGGARIDLNAASGIDLEVFESDGVTLIGDSLNNGTHERVEISTVAGQDYIILVSGETLTGTNPSYILEITEIPLDPLEPNESRAAAHDLISTTPTLTNLSLHFPFDLDYFRFVAPSAGVLRVDAIFTHSNGNVDISLEDTNGSELVRSDSMTDDENLSILLTAGQEVFLRAFSETIETSQAYDLDFSFTQPPTLDPIVTQTVGLGETLELPLTNLSDPDTPISLLRLGATSSNSNVIAPGSMWFDRSGPIPSLVIPSSSFGFANITITVDDGDGGIATESFQFRVIGPDPNFPPIISDIVNQNVDEDISSGAIPFMVNDFGPGASPSNLALTAVSSDQSLIADGSISFGGSGTNRTIEFTPEANLHGGPVTITVTVTDPSGLSRSDAFTVSVESVADVPNLTVTNVTGDEDTAIPLVITPALLDTDGSEYLIVRINNVPAGATLSAGTRNATNGFWFLAVDELVGLTMTPPPNYDGNPISLTVRAIAEESSNDDNEGFNQTLDVTINPVNDAPTVSNVFSQFTLMDAATGAIPFEILDIDTGDTLAVTATSSNVALVPDVNVVLGGSGQNRTVTVTPVTGLTGTTTITLTVTDGIAITTEDFVLTVGTVNDAPPVLPIISGMTTDEDTALPQFSVTVSDSETAAASLTVVGSSSDTVLVPSENIVITSGAGGVRLIDILPAPNQFGTTTITLTVDDDQGGQTTSSFLLTVNEVNESPTISDVADVTLSEDGVTAAFSVVVGDEESSPSSLALTATSDNTALVPNSNIQLGGNGNSRFVIVSPLANQFGSATITLTVSDGVNTTTEDFLVTVIPVNDAPTIANPGDQTTDENIPLGPLSFTIGDEETAASGLIVTAQSGNQAMFSDEMIVLGGSGANRTISLTPEIGQFGGPMPITLTVSDGTLSTTTTFNVTTNDVNQPPTISDISNQSTDEDTSSGPISFTVGDADNSPSTLIVTASSSNQAIIPDGSIVLSGSGANRTITVSPAPNAFGGPVTITVTVSDGQDNASDTFDVLVIDVNDAPVAVGDSATTSEDLSVVIDLTNNDTDIDGTIDDATLAIIQPTNGIVNDNGNGTVTYTPSSNFHGSDSFTYTVKDDDNEASNSVTVNLTVAQINDAGSFGGDLLITTNEDTIASGITTFSDPIDGFSTPNFGISNNAAHGVALINSAGNWTYTPASNFHGSDSFEVTVTDDDGNSETQTVNISVTQVDDAGVFSGDLAVTLDEDSANNGTVTFSDPADGFATANFIVSMSATNGSASIDLSGNWTYTPAGNFNGSDSFEVSVTDDDGNIEKQLIAITISPITDLAAFDDTFFVDEDVLLSENVSTNDSTISGGTLSYALATDVSSGSLTFNTDGSFDYTPASNFNGSDSFSYTVTDLDASESDTRTVSLTVNDINDAPVAADDSASTAEDTAVTIDLTDNDTDVDGTIDDATLVIVQPANGSVTDNGDGTVSYTPALNFHGSDTFSYTVKDDDTAISNSATVTVTISEVDDFTADFDSDADIDGTDFLTWQRGFGTSSTATKEDGDADGDGTVDEVDLGVWELQFGTDPNAPPALASLSAPSFVPSLAVLDAASSVSSTQEAISQTTDFPVHHFIALPVIPQQLRMVPNAETRDAAISQLENGHEALAENTVPVSYPAVAPPLFEEDAAPPEHDDNDLVLVLHFSED